MVDEQDLQFRHGFRPSARVPVAEATRALAVELVSRQHDPQVLQQAQELIDQARALLAEGEAYPVSERFPTDPEAFADFIERQMVSGWGNPFAPPSPLIEAGDGKAYGRVHLTAIYQGPPGRVHGGYVSVLLDHIVGSACASVLPNPYFTRVLTVDFLHAVPLNTDLELFGWLDELDGRKAWVVGEVRHGDEILARGRALMVHPRGAGDAADATLLMGGSEN